MGEIDTATPIEISLVVEGAQDAGSVRSILEVTDRLREEYGLAVRVDVASSVSLEPLVGWVHALSQPLDSVSPGYGPSEDMGYVILRDGTHVRVIVTGSCDRENLERALIEAALQALAPEEAGFESPGGGSDRVRSDPGSFASGEYIVFSAA